MAKEEGGPGLFFDRQGCILCSLCPIRQTGRNPISIAGWDINSKVSLLCEGQIETQSSRLGDFLEDLVSHAQGLHAYILAWDFAMINALKREFFPIFKLDWDTHRRIHFYLDDDHPTGASHH